MRIKYIVSGKINLLKFRSATAVLCGLMIILSSCERKHNSTNQIERKIPVTVVNISPNRIEDTLDSFGIIESLASVVVSAEQEGRVVEINTKEGEHIRQGQLILRIDDRTYKAELARTKANLDLAEANFKRKNSLFESKTISEKDYEDAIFARDMAKAEYDAALIRLERCEIRSPIDAYVDDIAVELGEYLGPNKSVARLEKIDVVKLLFHIPERDIVSIRLGTNISYSFDSYPKEAFTGAITFISRAAEAGSLTFRAEVEIKNEDLRFSPGMIARIKLVRRIIENSISIPIIAIIPRHGGHYVFVVKDGRAYQREVKIAFFSGEKAIISEGLLDGDILVVEGGRFLREKDMVDFSLEQK